MTEGIEPRFKKDTRIVGPGRSVLAGELAEKYRRGASIRALAEETGRSYGDRRHE